MIPTIGFDFEGTICAHAWPLLGDPVPHALNSLALLRREYGARLILLTIRSGDSLQEAVDYIESQGIILYGINHNPSQKQWSSSAKIHCDVYIDDAAVGCPLLYTFTKRPVVDWNMVVMMLPEILKRLSAVKGF